ncbi:hypothetical protein QJQ45_008353 [Haematococcus lacustris]|nr:hypothetical protein QJQ45_008353 [Haematococcus lacustris]
MWCPVVAPRKPPQAPRSSQAATQPAASEPGPSTPPPAKGRKRTKAEQAAEPTQPTKGKGKAQGKAAKAKPEPQPGRWLDRDCNAALNMQRIGESRWRLLELCYWPEQGVLPAKGKEYPGLGYKRLRDKPPKAHEQQPAVAHHIPAVARVLSVATQMAPIPAYTDIGKAVGDLFKGSSKAGAFQLDHKVTYSGVTSSGLNVTLTGITKGERVEPTLKAAYAKKGYSADVTYDGAAKVAINTSVADVLLPGLKLSGSVTLPNPNSAKASIDYNFPYLSTKATMTLTSKPLVDVVASTGYKDVVVGVEAGFDTVKSTVSKYNLAVGYHAPDFQIAASVLDKLSTVKVGYAHNVSSSTRVGAEVLRKLVSGDTSVILGYSKTLSTGALTKLKIDNSGLLTGLYETKLTTGEKVGASFQLHATDLSKPVKYGFAVDLA